MPRSPSAAPAPLGLLLSLLLAPAAVGAQGTPTLAELAPSPGGSPSRADRERGRFTVEEVIGPIPLTSSVTAEPTYEGRANGSFNAFVKLKGVLVVYPRWTSPPSKDYEIRLGVGYHPPSSRGRRSRVGFSV